MSSRHIVEDVIKSDTGAGGAMVVGLINTAGAGSRRSCGSSGGWG